MSVLIFGVNKNFLEHKILTVIFSNFRLVSKMFQIEQVIRELNEKRYSRCNDIIRKVFEKLEGASDNYTTR